MPSYQLYIKIKYVSVFLSYHFKYLEKRENVGNEGERVFNRGRAGNVGE